MRELEQKFQVLYSAAQERRDFDLWIEQAAGIQGYSVAVLFLDVDDFKRLNTLYTESVIDRTLLLELQQLVRCLCLHRGGAYRHGGEELLVLLPNCGLEEASLFAEKLRSQIASYDFRVGNQAVPITVSVGVAVWPHGASLQAVNRESE